MNKKPKKWCPISISGMEGGELKESFWGPAFHWSFSVPFFVYASLILMWNSENNQTQS